MLIFKGIHDFREQYPILSDRILSMCVDVSGRHLWESEHDLSLINVEVKMRSWFYKILAGLVALLLNPVANAAAEGPISEPAGAVLLEITGNITAHNTDQAAVFDLEMLTQFDAQTIRTHTIWTSGIQEFKGVAIADLMVAIGAQGSMLLAVALNDYRVEIPTSDLTEQGPIIAYEHNGNTMSIRDKGPLWVIYPYDSDPAYQTEVIYSRSIWQLNRIIVLE